MLFICELQVLDGRPKPESDHVIIEASSSDQAFEKAVQAWPDIDAVFSYEVPPNQGAKIPADLIGKRITKSVAEKLRTDCGIAEDDWRGLVPVWLPSGWRWWQLLMTAAAFIGVAVVSFLLRSMIPLVLFGLLLCYIGIMKSLPWDVALFPAVGIPNWRQRAISVCFLAMLAMPLWLVFGGPEYVVSTFCPADTLLSGLLGVSGLWIFGLMMISTLGFVSLIALILPAPKLILPTPKWPRPAVRQASRRPIAGIASACLLVIAIAMALEALSSSYCVRPQGIFIPAIPFGEGRIYAWSHIRKITTSCYRGSFRFDADMNDGQTIALGENEKEFMRNYRAVSDALRDVPFIYDNDRISECRRSLRDVLATRPGAHANEPL